MYDIITTVYAFLSFIGLLSIHIFLTLLPGGLFVEYLNLIPETCKNDPFVPNGRESTDDYKAANIYLPVNYFTINESSIIFFTSESHNSPFYSTQSFRMFPELANATSAST